MLSNIFKVAYLVAIYFLLSNSLFAQDNWTWLNPKPMGSTIQSNGYFPGTNTIVAVGAGGLIMRSTDNGTSWTHIQSNLTSGFYSVSIVNSTLAYVAGENAAILKTTDAGQTWSAISTSNISGTISQLQFISESVAFAKVGNVLYKSTNSGTDWSAIVTNIDGLMTTFCAISETKLFFGTTSGAYFSASQSGSWTPAFINTFTSDFNLRRVNTIASNGGNIVVFSDYEQLSYSTDAGVSWTPLTREGSSLIYTCATFISGDDLIAATNIGEIVISSNGGADWSPVVEETSSGVSCAASNNSNNVMLLGAYGVQYNSTNAGLTWELKSLTNTTSNLSTICAKDENEIYVGGSSGTLFKTVDGGTTWTNIKPINNTSEVTDIKLDLAGKIYFTTASGLIYSSINGGTNWSSKTPSSRSLQEISFGSLTQGVACGINNSSTLTVFYTADGGSSWSASADASASTPFYTAYFVPGTQTAYIAGGAGKINISTVGGQKWRPKSSTATGKLNSLHFINQLTGFVVGDTGYIAKTIDSATTWVQKSRGLTSANLQSVRFSDPQNGIIVGSGGTILKTTNGGETWVKSSKVTDWDLNSASLVNSTTILVAGILGTILKSYNAPLPVELVSFTASVQNNKVELRWHTATEIDNYGFEIERKTNTSDWEKIGFVEGHSTTNSPKYYNFTDSPSGKGKYQYRLKQIDNDGRYEYSAIVEVDLSGMLPKEIEIHNFPNPFNPETNINIRVPETSETIIELHSITGEKLATFDAGKLEAGSTYSLKLDGTGLPSGVYFIHVSAGKHRKSHKIMLMK